MTEIFDEAADAERVAREAEPRTVTGDGGRGHYLEAAGSHMAGRLPGGYLDDAGTLHKDFVVREMTGREEDLLVSKGNRMTLLNQVIANCLVSLGGVSDRAEIGRAVQAMPTADRIAVLITLRRASLGDLYQLRLKCPNEDCREEDTYSVDLGALEVRDMEQPTVRAYETTLPSGMVVAWHIMTARDEEWMAAASKKRREADGISLGALARIDAINGERLDRETDRGYAAAMERIKGMAARDRQWFREEAERYEGGVDTDLQFQCKHCEHEWEGHMPVATMGFFFPSARPKR